MTPYVKDGKSYGLGFYDRIREKWILKIEDVSRFCRDRHPFQEGMKTGS